MDTAVAVVEIEMLKLVDAVCAGELESFTCTVNVAVPDDAGVPEIAPDEALRDSPLGSDPLVTDQLYGVVPPAAERLAE